MTNNWQSFSASTEFHNKDKGTQILASVDNVYFAGATFPDVQPVY